MKVEKKTNKKTAVQCRKKLRNILECVNPEVNNITSFFNVNIKRIKWLVWAKAPGHGNTG